MERKTSHLGVGLCAWLLFSALLGQEALAGESHFKGNMVIQSEVVLDRVEVGDHSRLEISSVRVANSDLNGGLEIKTMRSEIGKIVAKDNATVSVATFDIRDTKMEGQATMSLSVKVKGSIQAGKGSTVNLGSFNAGPGQNLTTASTELLKGAEINTDSKSPEALTYARLYQCSVNENCIMPDGWEKVSSTDSITGYESTTFFNPSLNQHVLAFEGTDMNFKEEFLNSTLDWITNLSQGFGLGLFDPQYILAKMEAGDLSKFVDQNGGELVLIGHSLGGGLASAASLATGEKAVTFNAAGLHQNTVIFPKGDPEELITAYYIEGEILNSLQDSRSMDVVAELLVPYPNLTADDLPEAVGTRIPLKTPDGNLSSLERHNMDVIIDSLENIQI